MFDAAAVAGLGEAVPDPTLLRPVVAAAVAEPVGAPLLAALTALAPAELSAREQVEVCRGWARLQAHTAAGSLHAVAALDRVVPRPRSSAGGPARADSLRPAANELAAALGMSGHAASRLVGLARRCEDDLAPAADALADGVIDAAHLRVLAAVTKDAPTAADTAALQQVAVRAGRRCSPAQLRADLEGEAARRMPEWFARRAAAGRAERDAKLGPSPVPGCRRLTIDLPAVAATAVWLALDGAARAARTHKPPGDERTLAQLRADVLVALTTGAGGGAAPPGSPPGDPPLVDPLTIPGPERLAALAVVHVLVAADTLLGQSQLPAHVPSVGPVDVDHVRDLAHDARWRRVLTDPVTGTVEHLDERTYRPGAGLRRHVVVRDGTCVGPTCSAPASTCQVDHTVAHAAGGPTSARNAGPLCERDHDAKTHLGWRLDQPTAGSFRWTSPTGLTYDVPARAALPGWEHRRPDWAQAARHGLDDLPAA